MRDELLRLMYEQSQDYALILLDDRGAVVAWMMGAERIFGRDADEMRGRTIERLFTPEDQSNQVPETELDHARRSSRAEDDRWMVRSDGGRFWASGFVHCLERPDGRVAGYAKLLRDRTDQRGQVETLRNRIEALEAEDERKIVMFGTLAHELRNPLSVLTNAAQLIDLAYPGDSKLAYPLQVLRRQVAYVGSLVNDLLEIVRSRTGKAVLHVARFALRAVIDEAIESVEPETHRRRQHVEVLMPSEPVELEGDRVRLTQVFANLLTNASKFSPTGSPIWVKGVVEGDEIAVRVEDRGRGISPAMLPHVFDLLTQAEGDKGDRAPGLGLGLALVKEFVELHGGVVQVRSEGVGRGSEFTVRLPLPASA
jgi:two-component system CheB/CheR fusion protein